MSDVHDKETRSYNMSRISGKNTRPEMMIRKFLHRNGFRYSLHSKDLPGKPDLVLPKYNTVIFVHGCFWHAHENCKYFKIPKTRTLWWKEKLYANKERDEKHIQELEEMGWNIIVVWECKLKKDIFQESLEILSKEIRNNCADTSN